jgi:hypothetical protein
MQDGYGEHRDIGGNDLNLKNEIGWHGDLTCTVQNKDGIFLRDYHFKNEATKYALSYIAATIANGWTAPTQTIVPPSIIELGTGTGTPTPLDTGLWAPAPATINPCSIVQQYLGNYIQFVAGWQPTAPIQGVWTEAGLFDTAGNLWAHVSLNITINAGEMLTAQWTVGFVGL